jgi:hypothetical protein
MNIRTAILSATIAFASTFAIAQNTQTTSGTSIEPAASVMPMLMRQRNNWTLMLHGTAFLTDTQQHAQNERGSDKFFSTNSIMGMAQHPLGPHGQITLRAMFSLEPATVTGRYYPELFQQGETAYGQPIRDGQHPHDFFMELAAMYDLRLGQRTQLILYAAPIGDPAIGPTAYAHRASAAEDPVAPLGHHQEDSTHIAFNVLTAALSLRTLRLELSGFHGAEPTEARWHPQPSPNGHAIDSASSRLTWSPNRNLSTQFSIAEIASPEALSPGQNQRRQTASVTYVRSFGGHQSMPGMSMPGDHPASATLATTLLWGHTRNQTTASSAHSYLLETLLTLHRNALFTRIESAARTTELLSTLGPERTLGHVQVYTFGYDRDLLTQHPISPALGAQFTTYVSPSSLTPTYGPHPYSAQIFLRLRLE